MWWASLSLSVCVCTYILCLCVCVCGCVGGWVGVGVHVWVSAYNMRTHTCIYTVRKYMVLYGTHTSVVWFVMCII